MGVAPINSCLSGLVGCLLGQAPLSFGQSSAFAKASGKTCVPAASLRPFSWPEPQEAQGVGTRQYPQKFVSQTKHHLVAPSYSVTEVFLFFRGWVVSTKPAKSSA